MEEFFSMLYAIRPMSEELIHYLKATIESVELRKKEFLLKKGRVCNHLY